MHRAIARELFQSVITPEQAVVLFVIQAISLRRAPAEISRWLLREPHSTLGLLRRMEKDSPRITSTTVVRPLSFQNDPVTWLESDNYLTPFSRGRPTAVAVTSVSI